jgi:hypothetical protein
MLDTPARRPLQHPARTRGGAWRRCRPPRNDSGLTCLLDAAEPAASRSSTVNAFSVWLHVGLIGGLRRTGYGYYPRRTDCEYYPGHAQGFLAARVHHRQADEGCVL